MRKICGILGISLVFALALSLPAWAADGVPVSFIDWGWTSNAGGGSANSLNALVSLSDDDSAGRLYCDFGMDFGAGTAAINLGLTFRSTRDFFFFHPCAGIGLSFANPITWETRPYLLWGGDFACFFWEREVLFGGFGQEYIGRSGLRIRF